MRRNPTNFTPNRRELLTAVWIGAFAVVAWQFSRLFIRMANPHGLGSMLGGVIPLGSVDTVPAAGDPPIEDAENRLWLVNTPEGLLALDKTCTHLDCLLAWDAQAKEFFCPCHGSRFAQDGSYLEGPAPRGMDRYVVQVRDSEENVLAMTDVASGAPLPLGSLESGEPDQEDAAATEDETATGADDDATIWVDKSRKIQGAPVT